MKKSIVFVSNSLPTYDKDSGANRLKEIIEEFHNCDFQCYFLTKEKNSNSKYWHFFSEMGVVIVNFLEIEKIQSLKNVDYVWFNGPISFKKNLNFVTQHLSESKIIYDMVDVHFLRYKRSLQINPFKISDYKRYFKYKKIETKLIRKAAIVIAISQKEKEFISKYVSSEKVITISNIHYTKVNKKDIPAFNQREHILFIGSKHTPNIDAIHFLYHKVMPKVWKINKDIKVQIIGDVVEEIKGIANPMFEFLGYVPKVESYFLNSKFMVAPLRYGAGVKGKIGQAFEYYLPVITTDIGAEGMNLTNNHQAIITNDSNEFATKIIELYENEVLWQKLSNASEDSLKPFSKEHLRDVILYLKTLSN
ncbi:glycosyltransferase [Flavobacterium luminosum]|uniref:Glycosyltransferase family 4 protein n=1 Tax=Flavobacterium luminosum TaxID=2949086 RepID=A0ABT0TN95_9FLAO|nr:glycosyltransferase [Flavobacterium sp. HXWNR70]MCL9808741.1 glycosyltransferase family 4 protein [Flavobacterium sp. HXWNR70]